MNHEDLERMMDAERMTPSPAQGAEELLADAPPDEVMKLEQALLEELDGFDPWTHGTYPIAMESLADKLVAERYARAHVTAAKDKEVDRLKRALEETRLRLRITEEQANLVITTWPDETQ